MIKNYKVSKILGKGNYGIVYLVLKSNKNYVIKQIPLQGLTLEEKNDVKNEVKILSEIKSDYVVQLYESFEENNNLNIVMEYCKGGDLEKAISDRKQVPFDENFIWKIFIQILIGLADIHHKNILHRDLKTSNIFLTRDFNVKIGDFGVSKKLSNTKFAKTVIGTPYYLSPEIWEEKPYNKKSDIWALGCILYELCTFMHPFDATNPVALCNNILKENPEIPKDLNNNFRNLIEKTLQKKMEDRPSCKTILNYNFVIDEAKKVGIYKKYPKYILNNNFNKKNSNNNFLTNNDIFQHRGINKNNKNNNGEIQFLTFENNNDTLINNNKDIKKNIHSSEKKNNIIKMNNKIRPRSHLKNGEKTKNCNLFQKNKNPFSVRSNKNIIKQKNYEKQKLNIRSKSKSRNKKDKLKINKKINNEEKKDEIILLNTLEHKKDINNKIDCHEENKINLTNKDNNIDTKDDSKYINTNDNILHYQNLFNEDENKSKINILVEPSKLSPPRMDNQSFIDLINDFQNSSKFSIINNSNSSKKNSMNDNINDDKIAENTNMKESEFQIYDNKNVDMNINKNNEGYLSDSDEKKSIKKNDNSSSKKEESAKKDDIEEENVKMTLTYDENLIENYKKVINEIIQLIGEKDYQYIKQLISNMDINQPNQIFEKVKEYIQDYEENKYQRFQILFYRLLYFDFHIQEKKIEINE